MSAYMQASWQPTYALQKKEKKTLFAISKEGPGMTNVKQNFRENNNQKNKFDTDNNKQKPLNNKQAPKACWYHTLHSLILVTVNYIMNVMLRVKSSEYKCQI